MVNPYETYLFWPLRAYVSMPLPEYWVKEFDKISESYVYRNLQNNSKLSVHPCYSWIKEIIQFLRSKLKEHRDEFLLMPQKMVFRDQLKRKYETDLGAMMLQAKEGKRPHPLSDYFTSENKRQGRDGWLSKKHETNPSISSVSFFQLIFPTSLDFRDAHIIELAHQAGVDINTEIHLLSN